jgi:hypothetical protein
MITGAWSRLYHFQEILELARFRELQEHELRSLETRLARRGGCQANPTRKPDSDFA